MSFNLNTSLKGIEDDDLTATTYKIELRGVATPVVKYNDWYIPLNMAKALTGYDHKQPCKLFVGVNHIRANVFINNGDLDDTVFNYNLFFIKIQDAFEVIRSKKKPSIGKIKRIISDDMVGPMVAYAKTLPNANLAIPSDIKALPKVESTTVPLPLRKRNRNRVKSEVVKSKIEEESNYSSSESEASDDELDEEFEESDEPESPRPKKKQKVTHQSGDSEPSSSIKIDNLGSIMEEFMLFKAFLQMKNQK